MEPQLLSTIPDGSQEPVMVTNDGLWRDNEKNMKTLNIEFFSIDVESIPSVPRASRWVPGAPLAYENYEYFSFYKKS